MNKKAYTSIIGTFLILIMNFLGTPNLFAQEPTFDLRFQTEVDCNQNGFSATLQMKVRNDSFRIGTSSILFNYDETVLAIKDYQSITFDENNTVSIFGSETPVWSPHKFNSTVPGICNLTLLIDIAAASLPAVQTDWIDIGRVNFDVLNLNASPNLVFDIPNTNFNKYDPNDGSAAPTKGDFLNYNDLLATQCACSVPTVTNDTLNFDCFQSSFTANLISNDVISNATFNITANPTKGTASINPNGQLTYNSSDFFCGVDQLTYQVCNDGDAQCCAEATVFINFSDDVAPVFTNPPLDVTVSCDELPVFAGLAASDECSDIQMLQEESVIQGSCANSEIHVRTWTVFDGCGNSTIYTQNITVEDNVPPVINCLDDFIISCESNTNDIIDSGTPLYFDNCSDTAQIILTFSDGALQEFVQDKVVGQFTRTWTATDECGNFSTCDQVIQIIDDVAPILFCPSDITVNCGDDIPAIGTTEVEAYDSCSAVTLSFVDVGAIPAECNFDAVTVTRTWIAEDACGNRTECVQEITVEGSPCATTITREITQYLCEGATVNLKSMMGFADATTVDVFEVNEQPVTNPTAFELPLTGCTTGTFEFVFQTFNDAECLTENSTLIIKTIPNLIMTPVVAADNCSAELIFECPDLYEVTWSNGSNSGTGSTFIATPGQDGIVLFTIQYIGDNLSDSLDLICHTDYYEIEFDCQPDCPTGIQESIQLSGCEGDFINLVNELQINEGDSIVSEISTIDNFQEYELLADSDSCGVVFSEISLTIYNADGCPIRYVVVGFEVFKNVTGNITHENDFCKVRLNLDCPELYNVYWEDNNNVVGNGFEYEGEQGTSGFVTFHVSLLDTTNLVNVCGNNTFTADYACPSNCPETLERNESLTLCAESTVNIFDRLDLDNSRDYLVENGEIVDGILQIGNFFGCETGVKNYTILDYDENQCLIEVINLEITVIPAIYGDILSPSDTGCVITLGLECPENYIISWEDNEGNTGEGLSYFPPENTSGTVTFTVSYLPESIVLSAVELDCMSKTFQASFDCSEECPVPTERAETLLVCDQTTINFIEELNLSDNKVYLFDDERVIDGVYEIDTQYGCAIITKDFQISAYDTNQCLIEVINLAVTVFPPFFTNETRTSEDGCEVNLILECSELYTVTWEDDKGRTGEGFNYIAEENTSGTVSFFIEFTSDDSTQIQADLPCFSAITEGTYNCISNCPETIERSESFTVCAESVINIYDRLSLGTDKTYVIENENIIDGVYQIGNFFGCETGIKNHTIKGYDENQCLVEIVNLEITVIPAIYADIISRNDTSCNVTLSLECPENYLIHWEDSNGNSGTGTVYSADENTSGTVTFLVEYIAESVILSEADLPCIIQSFEASFNCTSDCPETIVTDEHIVACATSTINIFDRLTLPEDKTYVIGNDDIIDGVYQIGNPFGCEVGTKVIDINGYDNNQCLVEIIRVEVQILPVIYVDVSSSEVDQCTLFLSLECPEHYTVTWEDDKGNTGEGMIYTAEENTAGYVKFFVEYATDGIILSSEELSCLSQIVEANYNCISDCPETIERDESFTVCAESTINIFDRLSLANDKTYVVENGDIINGVYQIGNFFGCETGIKNHTIKAYDANQCLVEIINVEIVVLPAIYGDILSSSDTTCRINLALECPENYKVTWEDSNGNTGEGMNYTATENTVGVVEFTVEYLTDAIILSEDELACFSQVFEAEYFCTNDCPTPTEEIVELTGCHGDIINLKERFDFSDNLSYTILNNVDNIRIDEIILRNDTEDCALQVYDVVVEVTDENGCVVRILTIVFTVIPHIEASLIDLSEGCGVELELACAEKFNVFWSDDLGNRGEGLIYEAEEGTAGKVEFEISFKEDFFNDNALVNEPCFTRSLRGDFACQNTSPCALENKGVVFDGSEIAGCSLLIEMSDGTILEPAILPEGVTIDAGQELLFSYKELTDRVSVCQSGKIVEIICLENTCPEKGTPCTDGDLATINDAHDGNCNCVGESVPEVESEINLRFRPSLDCASNAYCVMIQGKAQHTDFSIGTSSIMVNYNADALEFADYTSAQFDDNETCIGGTSSPWGPHQYDATSVPGKMCLTMILNSEGVSCPEITSDKWEDIGQICFDIMDNEGLPNITFDTSKTHFNSSSPNDGTAAIKIGELHEIDTEDALACAENDVATMKEVQIRAFLQGTFKSKKGTMDDMLRKKGFIPLTEPYTGLPSFVHFGAGGGETTTIDVLEVKGDDAIVDWVFLELRSASDAKTVITTRAGLIQRDGDVVDVDGVSNLQFMVPDGSYYISIKHRNHLGAMTGEPIDFSSEEALFADFSDPNFTTYGTNAQTNVDGTMTLWGGNANPDKHIILAGGGLGLPDRDMIFFDIFLSLWFANPDTPITYNSVLHGYYGSDTNLDGKVKYQGPRNDIDAIIFFNVLFHPENTQFRLNFSISEQIP